jgi:hypothetical protein
MIPMETQGTAELAAVLRGAGSEELRELVEQNLAGLGVAEAAQVLRNPFLTREVVELLLSRTDLLTAYEIRHELARNPRTPQVRALRFVAGLFWRDLMRIGLDPRVHPRVRRAAERGLVARLPGLAVGEKMAIARRAGPGVLAGLRHDPSPRVLEALLENPRLTEGLLMPLVARGTTPPPVLDALAKDRRWGSRYELRLGLCRNPQTPVETVLRLLPLLKKKDLRAVASHLRLAAVVRRRARLLLGDGGDLTVPGSGN